MSWAQVILDNLKERDAREAIHGDIIANYKKLAQQTKLLKDRNAALLKASISARDGNANGPTTENPVQTALIASLEAHSATQKEELAAAYKTQSQNAQKLYTLSEKLRETEDKSRDTQEHMRTLKLETDRLTRKLQDNAGSVAEKEKAIQHLNDELATAHLEYTQLEKRNDDLMKDNKNLLQRWLDRMNDEVTQVNDANAFIESTSKLRAQTQNSVTPTRATRTPSRATTPKAGARPSSPSSRSTHSVSSLSGSQRAPSITSRSAKAREKAPALPSPHAT